MLRKVDGEASAELEEGLERVGAEAVEITGDVGESSGGQVLASLAQDGCHNVDEGKEGGETAKNGACEGWPGLANGGGLWCGWHGVCSIASSRER